MHSSRPSISTLTADTFPVSSSEFTSAARSMCIRCASSRRASIERSTVAMPRLTSTESICMSLAPSVLRPSSPGSSITARATASSSVISLLIVTLRTVGFRRLNVSSA